MANTRDWFQVRKDGTQTINSDLVYKELFPEIQARIDKNLPINQIISWLRATTEEAFFVRFGRKPTTGALNNSIGRWNEYIAISSLCEIATDLYIESGVCIAIFSMGSSTIRINQPETIYSKFLNLFEPDEFSAGNSLEPINRIKERIFFPLLKRKLKAEDIKGVVSLKTSNGCIPVLEICKTGMHPLLIDLIEDINRLLRLPLLKRWGT